MIAATLRIGGAISHQRWLIALVVVFFACVQVQYLAKLTHSDNGMRSAFLRWKAQLQDLDEGVNVWEKSAYPNPPIMAMILRPFFMPSPLLGATLWFCAKALMTVFSILLVVSLLDGPAQPFPWWGKAVAIGLSLRPIEGDLVHGNVNLFILFLLVASLYLFCQRREYLAGFVLGLSIACKLTPVLFIPYFLWKRSWQTLLGATLGTLTFILVIPGIVYGWHENLEYLRSWHEQMIAPYAAGVVTSGHKNQSLPGFLQRMLGDTPSFADAQALVIACMALFALMTMWLCRTSTERRPNWRLMAEFSVVILGMLLFCERTWKHHCVTLLLPFCVASYGLSAASAPRALRWYLGITLAAAGLLMFSTSSGYLDANVEASERWGKWAQAWGAYVWVFLLLLAGMYVILLKSEREPTCQPTTSR